MVTTTLVGRLGNQLFQLSAAYAHALRTGQSFYSPKKSANPRIWPTYFNHLPTTIYSTRDVYSEHSHDYTAIPLHITDVRLQGYFQSEKYFKEYRKEIIDLFKIPYGKIEGVCSLHIRLGDYLEMQDKHPVVSNDYLCDAVKYICEHTGVNKFMVFSDNIQEAQKRIERQLFVGCEFIYMPTGSAISDLSVMSCCAHNIIANSSYSWWAGWLNQNSDKIVIAPKVWFGLGNAHLDTKDLIPDEWIKL